LGEIAEVQTGPFGSQLHMKDYKKVGTPIITVEHLGDNKIIHNDLPLVGDDDKERLIKYILQEGDIVFSRVGSVDRRAYVTHQEDGWMFSGRCLRVRPKHTHINSRFLSFYFGQEKFKEKIRKIAVGATMPSINTTILSEVTIFVPPLPTQTRIASILTSFDDKIELLGQMNQTLETMAQTIFKEWFVNFNFPGFDGELVEGLPKGWRKGKLGEVCEIQIGRTPPRLEKQWFSLNENDVKWISIKDMGQSGVYIFNTSEYLTNEAIERFRIPMIKKNTLILSFKLTVGRLAITTEKMISNEAIAQLKSDINSIFLFLYFKNYNWNSLGSTSSIATAINSETIKEIEILVPTENALKLFNKMIDPIFKKIKNNSNQIHTLTHLRDALLPKLMSGQIEIKK